MGVSHRYHESWGYLPEWMMPTWRIGARPGESDCAAQAGAGRCSSSYIRQAILSEFTVLNLSRSTPSLSPPVAPSYPHLLAPHTAT